VSPPERTAIMVKLPERVKVGGHNYKVLFPYQFKERTDFCGQCDIMLNEIRLDQNDQKGNPLPSSKVLAHFIHEVLHALSDVWSVDLKEEKVVKLEQGITALLVDNGWVPPGFLDRGTKREHRAG